MRFLSPSLPVAFRQQGRGRSIHYSIDDTDRYRWLPLRRQLKFQSAATQRHRQGKVSAHGVLYEIHRWDLMSCMRKESAHRFSNARGRQPVAKRRQFIRYRTGRYPCGALYVRVKL
ncbi:hypothetical protein BS78_08G071600 [Paspalum vaginatum]|nr:hypothetical protein BS78_08G071600 [Paspalum vaginatum]